MTLVSRDIPHDTGFVEIADRCWIARFDFLDVNVGLVAGSGGLLVIDTHASEAEARRVVEQVRTLGVGDVVGVVNTHQHFDHTFGNVVFSEEYGDGELPLYAHDSVPGDLASTVPALQEQARADGDDPRYAAIADTRVLPPTHTFSSAKAVDLGDRIVELVHPGKGHTAGDIVVRVEDADVVFAGDLVEESAARNAVPGYGEDCWPMEWPGTLDLLVQLLSEATVVVPGHGLPVDKDFVHEQRSAIGIVAETIRDLASRGVPIGEAVASAQWPYPGEELRHAVTRGYEQLPRSARSLPLL